MSSSMWAWTVATALAGPFDSDEAVLREPLLEVLDAPWKVWTPDEEDD